MENMQRTHQRKTPAPGSGGDTPPEPGGAGLVKQSSKYGSVARKSRENCRKGKAAEQELRKRRNRSGQ